MGKVGIIVFIGWSLAMMVIGLVTYNSIMSEGINGEIVDCYDEYNNKFLDEDCVVEGGWDSFEDRQLYSMVIPFLLVIGGILVGGTVFLRMGDL